MQLVPLIRANRAIAASLIYPQHPVQAIAISEIISLVGPILNPKLLPRILGTTLALMYSPYFAYYFLKKYNEVNTIYHQAEICCLLLFVATIGIDYL